MNEEVLKKFKTLKLSPKERKEIKRINEISESLHKELPSLSSTVEDTGYSGYGGSYLRYRSIGTFLCVTCGFPFNTEVVFNIQGKYHTRQNYSLASFYQFNTKTVHTGSVSPIETFEIAWSQLSRPIRCESCRQNRNISNIKRRLKRAKEAVESCDRALKTLIEFQTKEWKSRLDEATKINESTTTQNK